MGKKQELLTKLLTEFNIAEVTNKKTAGFQDALLYGKWENEIAEVYKHLGGIPEAFAFRGKWDIVTKEFIIELDEELHFNDYRLITLSSPIYNHIKKFPTEKYRDYCMLYKSNCLNAGSYGGKWTNDSCEKMFGAAQAQGDLSGNGSPRWKQRAFYDFVKDASQLVTGIPVIRLSIYDTIDYRGRMHSIGALLDDDCTSYADIMKGLESLINNRYHEF